MYIYIYYIYILYIYRYIHICLHEQKKLSFDEILTTNYFSRYFFVLGNLDLLDLLDFFHVFFLFFLGVGVN